VSGVQSKVATLMANDVDFPKLVGTIRADAPTGMTLTGMTVSVNTGFSATGVTNANSNSNTSSNLDMSGDQHIGTITVTGLTPNYADVSAYVTKLSLITGLTQVYPVSSVAGPSGVAFSLQITLTDKLLTHRYAGSASAKSTASTTTPTTGGH
jgi:hypothetical protein